MQLCADYFDCFMSFFNCNAGTSGSTELVNMNSHALHYCNDSPAGNNCIFVPLKNTLVTIRSTRFYTKALHFVHAMFLCVLYNSYIKHYFSTQHSGTFVGKDTVFCEIQREYIYIYICVCVCVCVCVESLQSSGG